MPLRRRLLVASWCSGPATSVANESLQAIAQFISYAQRSSAGIVYVNDAALARSTLPTIIASLPTLAAIAW